jgi:hypothetical protein
MHRQYNVILLRRLLAHYQHQLGILNLVPVATIKGSFSIGKNIREIKIRNPRACIQVRTGGLFPDNALDGLHVTIPLLQRKGKKGQELSAGLPSVRDGS